MSEPTQRRGMSRISHAAEAIATFLAGTALFLIGPAIPQIIDVARSSGGFWVMVEGPVYLESRAAFSVEIQNRGEALQRQVELWVPLPEQGHVRIETDPFDLGTRPPVRYRHESGSEVAGFGDMKPGEALRMSVITSWPAAAEDTYEEWLRKLPHVTARVVSDGRPATLQTWRARAFHAEFRAEWFTKAFMLLSGALLLAIVILARTLGRPG